MPWADARRYCRDGGGTHKGIGGVPRRVSRDSEAQPIRTGGLLRQKARPDISPIRCPRLNHAHTKRASRASRSPIRHLRVFVPHEAMSAATMLACAADVVVMGRQSYMGPIDPQFQLTTSLGVQSVPAQAILDQFERARRECAGDRTNLAVWVPTLQQYGPALLEQCTNAIALSRELVSTWLAAWMFRRARRPRERAGRIADALTDHQSLRTHARPLDRTQLRQLGMRVELLETDQDLQDKVLSVYHATMHTFSATGATKVIENHQGRAFIKMSGEILIQGVPPPPGAPPNG